MSKKKSRRRVIKTFIPKVSTIFDCPFCNHKKSVEVKMDNKKNIGHISCSVCTANYRMKSNQPIDVYSEWIDECEKINLKDDK